ncbi:hypothetical protein [Mucilaginibacter sp. UR6-11]|uniref:hypothetical protein n=1 Tax=Mucilaginibacter sp. UR6-11 TaxID=1435644 RepID=UPI001E379FD2|nr:hypothetical protein [Mucilaginibacter sp. UR6-11]MCC8423761.1 hypothetical protein [Mucilaginibacter sp. UR6-11]
MKIKVKKRGEISDLQAAAEKEVVIEEKLDELIALLSQSEFDSETIKQYQQKLNAVIENKTTDKADFKVFKIIDQKDKESREQLVDEFSTLLISHKFNSKSSSRYLKTERTNKVILMLISIIIIALGFAMIIMPAPPYFEMFTIFYFSRDNGVTLMDLISLAIIFSGIYLFVRVLYKKQHSKER